MEKIFVSELFSDSGSESESDDEDYLRKKRKIHVLLETCFQKNKRKCITNFIELVRNCEEDEFISHFRVKSNIAKFLMNEYSKYIQKNVQVAAGGRPPISSEEKILTYLWFVGHQTSSFRDVSNRFNISLSTLYSIIKEVTDFLCDMAPDVIKWPNATDQGKTADYFVNVKDFPGVIGCIDGSHIKIDKPQNNPDSYYNRKKYFSVHIQGVCNEKRKFIDIFIGYPGAVHDARVFRNSHVGEKMSNVGVNKWLLGDSAYPCLRYLLTPYKDNGYLTAIQRNFNFKHSSSRICIEHTFGLLKQRFRVLYHVKLKSIPHIVNLIKACCVLHNLSDEHDMQYLEEPLKEDLEVDANIADNEPFYGNGAEIRDNIAADIYHQ